jgi:hypothetical protein
MLYKKNCITFWVKLVYLIRDLNLVIFRNTLVYCLTITNVIFSGFNYSFKLLGFSDHWITLLLDRLQLWLLITWQIFSQVWRFWIDCCGISSYWKQVILWASNWGTSYCCPLSRSIGRRVVWIPELVSKDDDLMTFLSWCSGSLLWKEWMTLEIS